MLRHLDRNISGTKFKLLRLGSLPSPSQETGSRETQKTVALVTTFRIKPKSTGWGTAEGKRGINYHNRRGFTQQMPRKLSAKPPLGNLPLEAAYLAGSQSALHRRTLPRNPARASLRAPAGRGPARRVPGARSRLRPSESGLQFFSPSALRPLVAISDYCLWRSP